LLDGTGLDSLLPAVSQPALVSSVVSSATQTIAVVSASSNGGPSGTNNGKHLGELKNDAGTALQPLTDPGSMVTGISPPPVRGDKAQKSDKSASSDSGSSSPTLVGGTTSTIIVVLQPVVLVPLSQVGILTGLGTGTQTPAIDKSVGESSAAESGQVVEGPLATSPEETLPIEKEAGPGQAGLANAAVSAPANALAIPAYWSNPQNFGPGTGTGLPLNQASLPLVPQSVSVPNGQEGWAGQEYHTAGALGLQQALLSTFSAANRWWYLSGAAGDTADGYPLVESAQGALPDQLATPDQGEEATPVPTRQPADLTALTPLSSGLLNASDDLGALERAFQEFLDGLVDLRQAMTSWLGRVGPLPWVLMGLAVAVTAYEEVARRRQNRLQGRDAEDQPEDVFFSASVDAG
jgi:hypothetical protein